MEFDKLNYGWLNEIISNICETHKMADVNTVLSPPRKPNLSPMPS